MPYLKIFGEAWVASMTHKLDVALRLGVDGSFRQIGGPSKESQEAIGNGPTRRVSFAIFEVVWGTAIVRKTVASSSTGYFSRNEDQEYEVMTSARMPVPRVCIYHVDSAEPGKAHAITGEVLARMMYECVVHQVSVTGGDANKMAYQKQGQQLNASYSLNAFQFWLDRMENTVGSYLKTKVPRAVRDMNVRQFHSISRLELQYLREVLERKVDVDPDS